MTGVRTGRYWLLTALVVLALCALAGSSPASAQVCSASLGSTFPAPPGQYGWFGDPAPGEPPPWGGGEPPIGGGGGPPGPCELCYRCLIGEPEPPDQTEPPLVGIDNRQAAPDCPGAPSFVECTDDPNICRARDNDCDGCADPWDTDDDNDGEPDDGNDANGDGDFDDPGDTPPDQDDDGDGIPDTEDPDHPSYKPNNDGAEQGPPSEVPGEGTPIPPDTTDREGESDSNSGTDHEGDPVIVSSGEFRLSVVDMKIPGVGLDFVFERRYRSRITAKGVLGYNWDHSYNSRIFSGTVDEGDLTDPSDDVFRLGSGPDVGWADGNGLFLTFKSAGDGINYFSPPGFFGKLRRNADGTHTVRMPDGLSYYFCAFAPGDVIAFLTDIIDRNGNRISLLYDANARLTTVLDTLGRSITFNYSPVHGRLASITDFTGRSVQYGYDQAGDLAWVAYPATDYIDASGQLANGQRVVRYFYATALYTLGNDQRLRHNLTSIRDAEGNVYLQLTYGTTKNPDGTDGPDYDRVIEQQLGGDSLYFSYYELAGETTDPTVATRLTTFIDRKGFTEDRVYNSFGNLLQRTEYTAGVRSGDPPSYPTAFTYDGERRLLRVDHPNGASVSYDYDVASPMRFSQGNVLRVTRDPGPLGGDQPLLVTEFTYEPLFNQVAGRLDEAKRLTTHTFDYQEGDPATNGANAIAQLWGIDLSSVSFNLGDVNGDGLTDQAHGNRIASAHPDANLYSVTGAPQAQTNLTTLYWWNGSGQMIRRVNPAGEAMAWVYETDVTSPELGYLKQRIVDPGGLALTRGYDHDALGNTIRVTDGRGVIDEFQFDALDRLTGITLAASLAPWVTDPDLVAYAYQKNVYYDKNGNVAREEVENRDGANPTNAWFTTDYSYDLLNRLTAVSREVDASTTAVTQYGYDANGNRNLVTYPEGNTDSFSFDERDLVWELRRGSSDAALMATYSSYYDVQGNLSRFEDAADTDGDGLVEAVLFEYDGYDRMTRQLDPVGGEMLLTYTPTGQIASRTFRGTVGGATPVAHDTSKNVDLRRTEFDYDELDRIVRKRADLFYADGAGEHPITTSDGDSVATAIYLYDRASRPTALVDDNGGVIATGYDSAGRLSHVGLQDGSYVDYSYDAVGNLVASQLTDLASDGLTSQVTGTDFVWDSLDRLIRSVNDLGHTRRIAYDSRGFVVQASDANGPVAGGGNQPGNTVRTVYDGLGRVTELHRDLRQGGVGGNPLDTSQGGGDGVISVYYDWDRNGRLTGLTDDNNNTTSYFYDHLNRRFKEVYADLTQKVITFDRDSNEQQVVDANGSTMVYTRDGLNRVVRLDVSRGAGVVGTTRQDFQWDGLSRQTLTYDNNDPAVAADDVLTRFTHSSLHKVISEGSWLAAYGGWLDTASAYDGASHLTQVVYPAALKTVSYTPDALGRPLEIRDGGATVATYTYLGPERVSRRGSANGVNLTTQFDAVRRLTQYRSGLTQPDDVVGYTYSWDRESNRTAVQRTHLGNQGDTYGYDSAYRLIEHWRKVTDPLGSPSGGTAWQWLLDGVGNWSQLSISGLPTITTSVDSTNEYTLFGGSTITHDANGNTTGDGSLGYEYDFRNRLAAVVDGGGQTVATYTYDAQNRRHRRQLLSGGSPTNTVYYLYRGPDVIGEIEDPGSGIRLSALYIHGPSPDEPVAVDRDLTLANGLWDPVRLYYHSDSIGSITALTDTGGSVVERYEYTAYGQVAVTDAVGTPRAGSAYANPYLFTGRRYDPESGNYYYRSRYYSPEMGRYLQRDFIGYAAGSLSLHEYVGGNPTNRVDPDGEFLRGLIGAAIGAVVGAVTETVSQLAQGKSLSEVEWGQVGAAAAGGAVEGAILAETGQAHLASIAGQAVEQGINVAFNDKSVGEAALDAGFSLVAGEATGKLLPPASKAPLPDHLANRIRKIEHLRQVRTNQRVRASVVRFGRNRAYAGGAGVVAGYPYGVAKSRLMGEEETTPVPPDPDREQRPSRQPNQQEPPAQGPEGGSPSAPDPGGHGGPEGGEPSPDPTAPGAEPGGGDPGGDPGVAPEGGGDSNSTPPGTSGDPAGEGDSSESAQGGKGGS